MTELWNRYGLEPYPRLAPPYSHVLGRGRLLVAEFDVDTARWEGVADYWRVDTAATVMGELTAGRGDLIVWVGPDERGGKAQAWPVSLVLNASRKSKGRQVISALAFDDHEAIVVDDRPANLRQLLESPALVSGAGRGRLLDLWSLDVLCPKCGGLGSAISYGLPLPPGMREDVVVLEPWDAGYATASGGCVIGQERYSCGRCGQPWPSEPAGLPGSDIGWADFHTGDASAWHPPVDGIGRPGGFIEGGPHAGTRDT